MPSERSSLSDIMVREEAIYRIDLELFSNKIYFNRKTIRSVITELLYSDPSAWKVTGITYAALSEYASANFRYVPGVQRAHLTDRKETVDFIFSGETPLQFEDLFSYWRQNDRCVLSTKHENMAGKLENVVRFSDDESNYFLRKGIGFEYSKDREGLFLRRVWENLSHTAEIENQEG
jgi:hypothetical protein